MAGWKGGAAKNLQELPARCHVLHVPGLLVQRGIVQNGCANSEQEDAKLPSMPEETTPLGASQREVRQVLSSARLQSIEVGVYVYREEATRRMQVPLRKDPCCHGLGLLQ